MGSATKRSRAPARSAPASRSSVAVRPAPTSKGSTSAGPGMVNSTGTFDTGPGLSIDHLIELQRTAGNRAVRAVIQRAPGTSEDDEPPLPATPYGKDVVTGGAFAGTGAPRPAPAGTSQERGPDPNVVVPVGDGARPRMGGQVPPGHGGAVDPTPRRVKIGALPVTDIEAGDAYRFNPASVFRSPSDSWHYQMWNETKRPDQGREPPPVFGLGRLIAVAPDHPIPATPIPTSIAGDDRTGLGTPQPRPETPLDRLPPRPERPMTRAIAPGFDPGRDLATRDTAVPVTRKEVLAAIAANPQKVVRSPSDQWHSQGYALDQGKGDAPKAYRVGDVIIIAPDYRAKGVQTPTYGAETERRGKGDVNVTKGMPGVAFDLGVEKKITQGGGDGGGRTMKTNQGATASLGGGNVASLGGQQTITTTEGDRSTVVKNAGNVTLKPDGSLVAGWERSKDRFKGTDDAGQPIKTGGTSIAANAGISDKGLTIGGAASLTNQAGNKHSATGSATFDTKGNMSGTLGYAFQSSGGTSFTPTVSGGVAVQASDPIPAEGGGFDVTYTITTTKGMGAGVSKQAGAGPSAGVQVGSTKGTIESGSRHFDDEKKATAFRDSAAATIAMERFRAQPPLTTVEGALAIPIGDERGSGDLSGSNIGASVSFEGASLAYGKSESTTHQFRVRHVSGKVVHVTGSVSGTKGSDLSGSGIITLNRGSSKTAGFEMVWAFDLGTKAGRDAFELYAKTGYPPFAGATVVSMTKSGSEEDHDAVSIPLLGTAKWTGTTWEVVKTDAKGTHEQFGGAQLHDQDPSWVGRKLGQDAIHSSAGITANLDTDTQGKQTEGFDAQFKVSGDSGEENRNTLGQIFMGVPHTGTAKASGEWTLTAQVSPDVVRELEKVNKEMREAPTKQDKMRVYSQLVKERGAKMVGAQVGLGGDATAWSLELKGDKNFPGPKGRAELERQRAALKDRLGKDPANARAVAKEVQDILDLLRARRIAVKDETRYTDLPGGLREQQLILIDKHITDFEVIRHKALREAVKQAAPPPPTTAKPGPADQGGYKNDANAAESADMLRLRTQIDQKETAISAIDPRIHRAIYAVTQASKHTANVPSVYGGWVMSHRADYNMHWNTGIALNERQIALAPKIDALRQKLLGDLFASDRKASAEALLAQLTDRLNLLEALHMEVIGAAGALKPTTTAKGMKDYPKFWSSINGDAPPWGGGSDEE